LSKVHGTTKAFSVKRTSPSSQGKWEDRRAPSKPGQDLTLTIVALRSGSIMALVEYWKANGKSIVSRLIPYWLIALAAAWSITFLYIWVSDDAYAFYDVTFASKVSSANEAVSNTTRVESVSHPFPNCTSSSYEAFQRV
jgi:hypothetical protein